MTHFQIFQFFPSGFDPKPDSWTTKQRSNSLVSLKKYFCGRKCNTWAYLYFRHKSPWIQTFSRERRGILAFVGRTNFSTRRTVHFLVLSTQTSRAEEYPRKAPRLHLRPQPTCLGHYDTKMRPWTTGKVGPTYQTRFSVAFSGKSLNLRWLMPKIQICSSIALASAKIFFQRNQWIRALLWGPAIGF